MPKRIVIVAMGESRNDFIHGMLIDESAAVLADAEVWTINRMAGVVHCDRVIAMDSFNLQSTIDAYVPAHLERLRKYQTPVYSCEVTECGLNTVEYPIREILATFGEFSYFNTSVAYAVALAIYEGVEELYMFGCDYTYKDRHVAESGRGCVEFWLGVAAARGVKIIVASTSSLLDQCEGRKLYGYSTREEKPCQTTIESDTGKLPVPEQFKLKPAPEHSTG